MKYRLNVKGKTRKLLEEDTEILLNNLGVEENFIERTKTS